MHMRTQAHPYKFIHAYIHRAHTHAHTTHTYLVELVQRSLVALDCRNVLALNQVRVCQVDPHVWHVVRRLYDIHE